MRHLLLVDMTTNSDSIRAVPVQQPTIGRYRVEKALGTGGMGTVYLGRHALLGRAAAIKVLLPSLSRNTEIVERFFNEARALTRITDPGIVQIFDFGHLTDGRAFIVMEFLDGESMLARLRRIRQFDTSACLRLSRLICGSLAAVHAKQVIHRDLKPGNIFIVDDPSAPGGERAKIFDFGIAKQTGDEAGVLQTRAGMLMGTPMYMSPEQCRGAGDIDHRSDIYSIGCVMFTMLTGRPPFGRGAPGELVVAHLREPAPLASSLVPGVPAIVDDILQRCLKKSPDERFQSMTNLAHAIGVAEQMLTRPTTRGAPVAPVNVLTRSSVVPSLDGRIAAPMSHGGVAVREQGPASRNGTQVPKADHADPGEPATTTLHQASGHSIVPGARAESSRRRWVAGALAASLIGVVGALMSPGNESRDRAPLGEASTVQATALPSAAPQPPPGAAVDPPVHAPPAGALASDIARPNDAGKPPSELAPPPPRRTPATSGPYPGRLRANGNHSSHPDTREDHANARQATAPSNTEPQSGVSEDITRGD
jgi:eukaryotic-like serine/threonine-protein kinase